MIDPERLQSVVEEMKFLWVQEHFGKAGRTTLHDLLTALRKIYRYIDPPRNGPLYVFRAMEDDTHALSKARYASAINPEGLCQQVKAGTVIQILKTGAYRVWQDASAVVMEALSKKAIVYYYSNQSEYFLAKGSRTDVPKIDPAYDSLFALPMFSSVREALEQYKVHCARTSSCKILVQIWADDKRLFLRPKPESTMRDSLVQHLRSFLRGVEVRPEQVVDESHPVDIKITWFCANRLALIEIKWLGDSREGNAITTSYRDSRARDGARQLAEYLDANRPHSPSHVTRGILVVFDARRKGLKTKPNTTSIARADGMAYSDKEIKYAPEYDKTREDFDPPIRFFLEPVC